MKNYYLLLIAIILHVVTACVFFPSSIENEISVGELVEWMESDEEIVILDVRNPEELDAYIKSSKALIYIAVAGLSAALPGVIASKTL